MTYKVDYEKLDNYYKSLAEAVQTQGINIDNTLATINVLIASTSIQGSTAEHMRDYFRDVHVSILSMMKDIYSRFLVHYMNYITSYLRVDGDYSTRISSEELRDLIPTLQGHINSASYIEGRVKQILRGVNDIYSPGVAFRCADTITDILNVDQQAVKALDQEVQEVETSSCADGLAELKALLTTLKSFIQENLGHNSIYITSYGLDKRSELYQAVNYCHNAIDADLKKNGEYYREINQEIFVTQIGWRNQAKLRAENDKQMKKAAKTIRIWGYVGDFCITGFELTFTALGIPEPAIKIIGGGAGGGWKGYYTGLSDQLENYQTGEGALINQSALNKNIVVGSIKGTASGVISVGVGELFDHVGDEAFVYKMTSSENPVTKHGSKLGLKLLEKEFDSINSGISDRVIDTTANSIETGHWSASAYWDAISPATVWEEEIKEGGLIKSAATVSVGYLIDEGYKSHTKETIKTPEDLKASHTLGRTISKGGVETGKSVLQETAGEFVVGAIQGKSIQTGIEGVTELWTDEKKREAMISGAVVDSFTAGFKDIGTQQIEKELIEANRQADVRRKATEGLGWKKSVSVDQFGNPDYSKTSAMYQDRETKIKAEVEVNSYGVLSDSGLCREAEKIYGSRIGQNDFKTPEGYKWVMKFNGEFGSQKRTLQLVRSDMLPTGSR